jgi:hypothetical protein
MKSVNKVAFIVGNGISRREVNLDDLVGKAKIYGCNALYRDFKEWDYLVTLDDGMTRELQMVDLPKNGRVIIPRDDECFEPVEYSPYRRRNNAGMLALKTAIDNGAEICYCIGMDFVLKGDIATDNVYKNTENYGPETHANQDDNYHRIQYLTWFARQYPNVKFVFVVPDTVPMRVIEAPNIVGMKMETFKKKLK